MPLNIKASNDKYKNVSTKCRSYNKFHYIHVNFGLMLFSLFDIKTFKLWFSFLSWKMVCDVLNISKYVM